MKLEDGEHYWFRYPTGVLDIARCSLGTLYPPGVSSGIRPAEVTIVAKAEPPAPSMRLGVYMAKAFKDSENWVPAEVYIQSGRLIVIVAGWGNPFSVSEVYQFGTYLGTVDELAAKGVDVCES